MAYPRIPVVKLAWSSRQQQLFNNQTPTKETQARWAQTTATKTQFNGNFERKAEHQNQLFQAQREGPIFCSNCTQKRVHHALNTGYVTEKMTQSFSSVDADNSNSRTITPITVRQTLVLSDPRVLLPPSQAAQRRPTLHLLQKALEQATGTRVEKHRTRSRASI